MAEQLVLEFGYYRYAQPEQYDGLKIGYDDADGDHREVDPAGDENRPDILFALDVLIDDKAAEDDRSGHLRSGDDQQQRECKADEFEMRPENGVQFAHHLFCRDSPDSLLGFAPMPPHMEITSNANRELYWMHQ